MRRRHLRGMVALGRQIRAKMTAESGGSGLWAVGRRGAGCGLAVGWLGALAESTARARPLRGLRPAINARQARSMRTEAYTGYYKGTRGTLPKYFFCRARKAKYIFFFFLIFKVAGVLGGYLGVFILWAILCFFCDICRLFLESYIWCGV